jgi:solute carrier family 25 protein 39/40
MTEKGHSARAIWTSTVLSSVIYSGIFCPFDVVKNSIQVNSYLKPTSRSILSRILQNEGLKGLWRGLPHSVFINLTGNLTYYTLYEALRPRTEELFGSLGFAVAGGISKLTSATLVSPIERMRTQIQGLGQSDLRLSLAGFRGIQATLMRDTLFSSIYFTIMENMYISLKQKYEEKRARLISSLVGGSIAVILTHPFDVMKTMMQTRNCCYEDYQKRPFVALKVIVQKEGMGSLMQGLLPRFTKTVPGVVVYISLYEMFKKIID